MTMKKFSLTLTLTILVLLAVLSATSALAQLPPTWKPPKISKNASENSLGLGDPVTFTIIVVNPGEPGVDAAWYNMRVTDNVDPALRIDGASSTMGTATVNGQQVIVNGGITLAAGQQFVVTIDCTLVGPITSEVLYNYATLEYTDEEGTPQKPKEVEDPVKIIIEEEVPAVVPEASTIILMGSAASGLIGYAGLQIRARKRKRS
jgi:fimbrial isopeptide formation D2 family protein